MEKDIALGSAGGIKLSFAGGKGVVELDVGETVLNGGVVAKASVSASADAGALIDMLFAAIEAGKAPGTVAIEEGVKMIVKNAVLAIQ